MNVGQLKQLLKSTGLEDEALVLMETDHGGGKVSLDEVVRATASIDFGGSSALIIRQPDVD